MKKLFFLFLAVVFIFSFSAPAIAKSSKPPKSICFNPEGTFTAFSMATKKGASMTMGGEKVSFYFIQGVYLLLFDTYPLTGSGYMVNDDFIFNLQSNGYASIAIYGAWNIVSETGFVNIIQSNSTNSVTEDDYALLVSDCTFTAGPPVTP